MEGLFRFSVARGTPFFASIPITANPEDAYSPIIPSRFLGRRIVRCSTVPAEALATAGESGAVFFRSRNSALTLNATHERMRAPRFWGSSIDAARTNKGEAI